MCSVCCRVIEYSYNIQNTFSFCSHIQPVSSPYTTSTQRECLHNTHTIYRTHSVLIHHTEHILYSYNIQNTFHIQPFSSPYITSTPQMSTQYSYNIQNTFCPHTTYRTHFIFSPSRVLAPHRHNANVYTILIQYTEHILSSYNIQNTFHIQPFLSPYITSTQRECPQLYPLYLYNAAYRIYSVEFRVAVMWCKDSTKT